MKALKKSNKAIDHKLSREKLNKEVDQKLKRVKKKIDELKGDASKASKDVKGKIEEERDKLEVKYAELKADYLKFQEAAEDKWHQFKEGFGKSFDEMSKAFKGLFD